MTTTLSTAQEEAKQAVLDWFAKARGGDVFRLFGYAGTGKTTIAQAIVAALVAARDGKLRYRYATFTGKAASVMRSKGCNPCSTIHGLCYRPLGENDKGELKFEFRPGQAGGLGLIIIDECSMVGSTIGRDLERLGAPILVLGDPFQLPPVGDGGHFTNGKANVTLTEIHRQAEDSGVLRMATTVRTGGRLSVGEYEESQVVARFGAKLRLDEWDQVICGTHKTRKNLNAKARAERGVLPDLRQFEVGEKVVLMKNNHGAGVMNGETGVTVECSAVVTGGESQGQYVTVSMDDGRRISSFAPLHRISETPEPKVWSRGMIDLDLGYAITCHKAQGSQWDNVLVFDESWAFREDGKRWLYTAITRAAKKVVVVA